MNRLMILMRPFSANLRFHRRQVGRSIFLAALLLPLVIQTISKNIPNAKRDIIRGFVSQSVSRNNKNKEILRNCSVTLKNEDKDGDFHIAYSGYLRDSSSMIMLQTNHVPAGSEILPSNNSTAVNGQTSNEPNHHHHHHRAKRGVTHLYNMIVCATGCDPLSYKGYACYCGFLGSGYPMDGIDRCCKMHDLCYDATECPMFVEYFVPYYWKCYGGYKPICAIEHGEWGGSGSCAQRLCECDRSFAECLRRYRCPKHKALCTSSPWRLIQNIFMIV